MQRNVFFTFKNQIKVGVRLTNDEGEIDVGGKENKSKGNKHRVGLRLTSDCSVSLLYLGIN